MIQPPRALPFNTMKPALIYTPTLLITPDSRLQKHLHVILSRYAGAKALRPKSRGAGGQDAQGQDCLVKAKTILSTKAVLIVKSISPPFLKNVQMQMFCTSLEPNTKQGQDADLSIMTSLTLTNPGAKSLFDLGVRCKPRSETIRGMIAAFDSMLDGTFFDASQASSDDFETSG